MAVAIKDKSCKAALRQRQSVSSRGTLSVLGEQCKGVKQCCMVRHNSQQQQKQQPQRQMALMWRTPPAKERAVMRD